MNIYENKLKNNISENASWFDVVSIEEKNNVYKITEVSVFFHI